MGGLSKPHVRLLMEAGPDAWPALTAAPADDRFYDVTDGAHRLEASRRLNLASLPCVVVPGAGYPEADASNLNHGMPLSMADRKEAARWWAHEALGLSFREIGRRCGLNHETANKAIEAGDATAPAGENRQSDPILRLVGLAFGAYRGGAGRSVLGFGMAGSAAAFCRQIDAYDDDERPKVAEALAAFGRAIVAATDPYLADT